MVTTADRMLRSDPRCPEATVDPHPDPQSRGGHLDSQRGRHVAILVTRTLTLWGTLRSQPLWVLIMLSPREEAHLY